MIPKPTQVASDKLRYMHSKNMTRSPHLALILLAMCAIFSVTQACSATAQTAVSTVTYASLEDNFANPERGLYHYLETRASQPSDFNLQQLTRYRTEEKITLTYCIVYLDDFVASPISADFLTHIDSNFSIIRQAGLKCLLRFAYNDDSNGGVPPFGDASKETVLQHIQQLTPILQKNKDVIALLQAGFIGTWGEWYYTDHFVDDPNKLDEISAEQWQNRLEIIEAEMAALPDRFVAVRYSEAKQLMLGTTTPLTAGTAHDGSTFARLTFHNDCFLASENDLGSWYSEASRQFMADDSKFGAMGGESCRENLPRSGCETALAELAEFHFAYLNIDYRTEVLDRWRTEGCFDEIVNRLGYRLELLEGRFSDKGEQGGPLDFNLTFRNVGYSAPFNPRPVQLMLRHETRPNEVWQATLHNDVRTWFAGETQTLAPQLCLPKNLPAGNYDLLLNLPDEADALSQLAEYSILMANGNGVHEAETGLNNLKHQVSVEAISSQTDCITEIVFKPLFDLPPTTVRSVFLPLTPN